MSNIIYLTLTGERQGEISSGCGTEKSIGNRFQYRHENEILVYQLSSSSVSTTGGVHHQGLRFTKPVDKSSPLLTTAINENEKLRLSYDYIRSKHLIANTEFSNLVLPDNYNQLFPPDEIKQPEKRNITLTLGVFFDGTGNNAVNTQNMLAACTAAHFDLTDPDAESILARTAQEQMGVSGIGATSYTGGYTNIHWLNTLYKTDLPIDSGQAQAAIYVEGIGTEAGKADSMIGLSFGVADTGVIAKTDLAVKQIAGAINKFFAEAAKIVSVPSLNVVELKFDIFGFSRGAAAARHFANRIQMEDLAIINAIRYGMSDVAYFGAPAGKTRFIGIFDTVAAIGTPQNGLNPHTANTGDVNIVLRPGVAEKVFHITAQHECRFNFALNSVQPAWPELALPGAHSDIGGGYLPVMRENLYLTRPEAETVPLDRPLAQTRAYRNAVAQLSVLDTSVVAAPLIRTNEIVADAWEDTRMPVHPRDGMQKRAFAALAMKQRIVKNDWSKVVLRVMIEAAQNAGAVFKEIQKNDALNLSPDLLKLSEKAMLMGTACRSGKTPSDFNQQESDYISETFIHCSANWNSIVLDRTKKPYGSTSVSETLGFVNRPDENWQRTIYNMDGIKK